ncbi:transcriptional regulator [Candidatus Fukatsuia symbiotica]|uniref:Transcriptional regulator n=1 Tax=Candidatus Fukatsuia symbiotica TaxID=1878942 RepID=A0A2U8I8A8_9GAMM|nr:transcriptional regulator [Candidatus Fukatsuia symbiotica]AWK15446.1 transcriptional regulator [Candidatus Fukatsuia symbiotica]MEA9443889.1 transcriptional regulator [Candidatus Fukatsuia symbiotica]
MATFDITQFPELREVFPELTPAQFETGLLFSLGVSQKNIALLRSVSYPVVKKTLAQAKSKFEPYSLYGLFTVFHVRLVLFALQECKQRE